MFDLIPKFQQFELSSKLVFFALHGYLESFGADHVLPKDEYCADRSVLRRYRPPLQIAVHLAAAIECARCLRFVRRSGLQVDRHAEAQVPQHRPVDELPVKFDKGLVVVVENQTAAKTLQVLKFLSSRLDFLANGSVGVVRAPHQIEVGGCLVELLELEKDFR